MAISVSTLVLDDIATARISSAALPVYLLLKVDATLSQESIASRLGMSVPSVQRHVSQLKKSGWINVQRAQEVHGKNIYTVYDQPVR